MNKKEALALTTKIMKTIYPDKDQTYWFTEHDKPTIHMDFKSDAFKCLSVEVTVAGDDDNYYIDIRVCPSPAPLKKQYEQEMVMFLNSVNSFIYSGRAFVDDDLNIVFRGEVIRQASFEMDAIYAVTTTISTLSGYFYSVESMLEDICDGAKAYHLIEELKGQFKH